MKQRVLSLITAIAILASFAPSFKITASAAGTAHEEYTPPVRGLTSIKLGDYIEMGAYDINGDRTAESIKWRCVAFEKVKEYKNGVPVIDSTDTVTEYKDGYLPLMLADTEICNKEFDAGYDGPSNKSHSRGDNRGANGSNYWGDSNIRDWLNGNYAANTHTKRSDWSCGNRPYYCEEAGFLTNFSDTEKAAVKTVTQKSLLADADKSVSGASGSALHTYDKNITDVVQNYTVAYSEQVTDTMFLLDVQQLKNVYDNYGDYYKSNKTYWLRSPKSSESGAVLYVYPSGGVYSLDAYYESPSIRPAFFLNLSSSGNTDGFIYNDGNGSSESPYAYKTHPAYTEPATVSDTIYKSSNSALIEAGAVTSTGCKMQYKLASVASDGSETIKSNWSDKVPTASSSLSEGEYKVYWRVVGSPKYFSEEASTQFIEASIIKAIPTYTAPTAKVLTYTGKAQALVTAGSATGGEMQYSLSENGDYSTNIPQGTSANTYTVWYKVIGDSNHYDIEPQSVTVTIARANPTVAAPTAKSLTYTGVAQELVSAGSTTGGTMQYSTDNSTWGTSIPTGTDTGSYTVYYKVVGDDCYNDAAAQSVTVTIGRKSITGTISITGTATMGKTLTASSSASGETVSYQWYRGDTAITGATSSTYTLVAADVGKAIKVTATGTGNYIGTATSSPTAAVGEATPTVSKWPTASAITYGQSLGDSTLTGGTASVAGTFTWTNTGTKPAVADSGKTQYDVTFTPSVDGYNSVTGGKVTLTVNKATLTPSATADSKTYDGTTNTTGTISLTGAVNSESPAASGAFAFANANAGADKTVNVTGITLTGEWGKNYQLSSDSTTATATIDPKSISGAAVTLGNSLTYTGSQQTQTVSSVTIDDLTATYTVSDNQQTNAGTYTLTVTGTGNFNGSATKSWAISKASNSIIGLACGNIVFEGTPSPTATATFGTPTYSYSNQQSGTYGAWNTSNAKGTWYVKATVAGTDNYSGAEQIISFQVTAQQEASPSAGIDYGAETLTGLTAGASYSITPANGTADTIAADSNGAIAIQADWFNKTLSIVKAARDNNYSDSEAQSLSIPARPTAPALEYHTDSESVEIGGEYYYNTTSGDYTAANWTQGDGSAVGVTPGNTIYIYKAATVSTFKSAVQSLTAGQRAEAPTITINYAAETLDTTAEMEYSLDGSTWSDCGGAISVTAWAESGQTVYVRIKATGGTSASQNATVNVPVRPSAPTLTISNAGEGVTIPAGYLYGAADGYDQLANTADGSLVVVQAQASVYICAPATETGFKSAIQTLTAPSRGAAPTGLAIDYGAETLSTAADMQYKTGDNWQDCTAGMGVAAFGWNGTEVTTQLRTKATESNYASEAVNLTIPARPAAPNIQGVNETFSGENDGQIIGTSTDMEYSADGNNWTPCGGTSVTSLTPGTYYVRTKATDSAFVSGNANVTIQTGPQRTYTLEVAAPTFTAATYGYTQPAAQAITITSKGNSAATISSVTVSGSGFTIGGSGNSVTAGSSITSWTVQPNAGLGMGTHTGTITVTYNNNATATATVSFTVSAKAEDTPNISINYQDETLTGFDASASYTINGTTVALNNGTIAAGDYMGQAISIVRTARDADYADSSAQSLQVPARPNAPTTAVTVSKTASSFAVTNVDAFGGCEFSLDGASWQDGGEFTTLTAGQTYALNIRVKATATAFASLKVSREVTTVNADGSTTVKPGDRTEIGTVPKTTVTNDGEKTTITTEGGKTVTVTPDEDGATVKPGGEVEVPAGSTVNTGSGSPEVTLPQGGAVNGNGEITIPGGGTAQVGTDPITTITAPEGGGTFKPNPDGTVDVPSGSIVQTGENGPEVTLPQGGKVKEDGTITAPEGGTVQIGKDPTTTVTPPTGGEVKPNQDGTLTVSEGTTIKTGDGPEFTVGPGNGGTVGGNGEITVPSGGTVQVGTNPVTTITPPTGGEVKPNQDGTVTVPGGTTVKTGDGPEVTVGPENGGTVGGNGEITVPSGGTVQVGTDPVTTITPPTGGKVKPNQDGTVTVPEGTTVKTGDSPEITVGPGNSGTVGGDGGVTIPGGGKVTVKGDPDTAITLPSSGTIKPSEGGVSVPGGSTVQVGTQDPIVIPPTGGVIIGSEVKYHVTVTFDTQGGSDVPAASVIHGGKLTRPDDPTKSGHTFEGWYKDAECQTAWDFETDTVDEALTLYAKWTARSSGGNYTPSTYSPMVEQPKVGGTVGVTPTRPKKGDTVTITPKPEDGYRVDKVVVTDRNGKEVTVTVNPDGTYSFVQPSGSVKIEVSYTESRNTTHCDGGSACGSHGLSDVGGVDVWYHDAVDYVLKNGLMNGYGNGRFGPNDDLSRAQLAQILYNQESRPAVSGGGGFADTQTGAWYSDAVTWAAGKGIVTGYGSGAFGPDDPITREQLAVMLWRYAGQPAAPNLLLTFTDAGKAGDYAQDAIRWAVDQSIITGKTGNILDPKGKASRAEVATMLMRYLENKK